MPSPLVSRVFTAVVVPGCRVRVSFRRASAVAPPCPLPGGRVLLSSLSPNRRQKTKHKIKNWIRCPVPGPAIPTFFSSGSLPSREPPRAPSARGD